MEFEVVFTAPLQMEALDGGRREFELDRDFSATVNGTPLVIPAGFITDFASVPRLFQNVVENDDPDILKPSVIHDFLYSRHGLAWLGVAPFTRAQCDAILRAGMAARGAPAWRQWAVWSAVRIGGWAPWDGYLKAGAALGPHLMTGAALLGESPRSGRWRAVRAAHLRGERWCRGCGGTQFLEVHHIKPFHLHPELELHEGNLITLCEAPGKVCHLMKGHFGNWSKFNPRIRQQATVPRPY